MVKLVSIWMICSLADANRQQLVESQNPRVLKQVCMKTYRMDPETIFSQTTTYDSLILISDANGILRMHYYLNGEVDSSKINTNAYDTTSSSQQTESAYFQLPMSFSRLENVELENIEFPVYHRTFSMCPDPQCGAKHGHIQSISKSWYSAEFGRLIISGGKNDFPDFITVLIGTENNPFSGQVVEQLMINHFAKDSRVFQKYAADYHAYTMTKD